ncbi:PadR family transcriptional regulator [Halobium palmae]|uniref:PadR family transcriptional regulator n=1 Tax=Halobium palmae TaxID=1776492 RepID=A0ABD5S350_9EURY
MAKWLQSGLRRDICVVVAGLDEPTDRAVKRGIETKYGETVRPKTFHGAMRELVEIGYLDEEADGLQDRYALTELGRDRLAEQFEWMRERVE